MKRLPLILLFIGCFGVFVAAQPARPDAANAAASTPVKILSKPAADFTDPAKVNRTEGLVRLKVTFLSSGEIGTISVVYGLPNGLSERAIEAAKNIRFEPATRNGVPVSVTKTIEYLFVLFVIPEAELPRDAKKLLVLEQPAPEYPAGENFAKLRGFVRVKVLFTSFGEALPQATSSNLPAEFEIKALEAARKIKYEPAATRGWGAVSVTRTIEYEFTPKN